MAVANASPEGNAAFSADGAARSEIPAMRPSAAGPLSRRGYSLWDEDRESTRYLAAATQLDVSYAQKIVNRVVSERFRALAPSYGLDVAVVAKWALSSLRLRARSDKHLAIALALGLLLFIVLIILWPWASIAVPFISMTTAWVLVARENVGRVKSVCRNMLRDKFDMTFAPDPSDQGYADRLAMVSKRRPGNLVVFRDNNAFVGSGIGISREHVVIDVSRGRADGGSGSKRSKPKKFTNEDVHAAIIAEMRTIGLADARVEERLFVNGKHIHDNPAILPDRKEPPNSSVDYSILKYAALNPTPDARVYVCVEMPSWQGQLVVTLFTRAVHVGGSLYVEWRFCVLRPVWKKFQRIDDLWDEFHRHLLVRDLVRESAIEAIPALLGAWVRILRSHRKAHAIRKAAVMQERAIDRGQVFDYGAKPGIREEASGPTAQHYFLGRDETMSVLLAQEKLIRAVGDFLAKKKVDTGQLDSQVKIIVEETHKSYSQHIHGDVSNSNIAFGKNAQASGAGNSNK